MTKNFSTNFINKSCVCLAKWGQ